MQWPAIVLRNCIERSRLGEYRFRINEDETAHFWITRIDLGKNGSRALFE